MKPNFKDKTVFITGASSGIGEELTYQFDKLGVKKIIIASRRTDELERVKANCKAIVDIQQLDLSQPEACLELTKSIFEKEPVHYVILNGGTSTRDLFENTSQDVIDKVININCKSNIAITMAAIQSVKNNTNLYSNIKEHYKMNITFISSVSGLVGVPFRTIYCASKQGISGFAKALRIEAQYLGVQVCNIQPAYVKTNISKNALIGNGDKFNKTDKNIAKGIPVQDACRDIIKSIYTQQSEVIIGSLFYQLVPQLAQFSFIERLSGDRLYRSQKDAKEKAE